MNRLKIHPVLGRVQYTDKPKDREVSEDNASKFNPNSIRVDTLFQKTQRFSQEKEVRIVWVGSFGDPYDSDYELLSIPFECLDITMEKTRFTPSPTHIKRNKLRNKSGDFLSLDYRPDEEI